MMRHERLQSWEIRDAMATSTALANASQQTVYYSEPGKTQYYSDEEDESQGTVCYCEVCLQDRNEGPPPPPTALTTTMDPHESGLFLEEEAERLFGENSPDAMELEDDASCEEAAIIMERDQRRDEVTSRWEAQRRPCWEAQAEDLFGKASMQAQELVSLSNTVEAHRATRLDSLHREVCSYCKHISEGDCICGESDYWTICSNCLALVHHCMCSFAEHYGERYMSEPNYY